jgi:hypothetical protein
MRFTSQQGLLSNEVIHCKRKNVPAKFDVFVSYKTRRYASEAGEVAQTLGNLGYRVWFDKDVLGSKGGGEHYTKEQLIDILAQAVKDSRCSVVFEAELEKVMLLPGMKIEEECQKKTIMLIDSQPVAWNWQKLEIEASSKVVAIHPSSKMIFIFDNGTDVSDAIGLPTRFYADLTELLQIILQSLNYFKIVPK